MLATIIRPIIGLYALLLAAGLLNFQTILEQRISLSGIPINLIEIICVAILPSFIIINYQKPIIINHSESHYFRLILIILCTYFAIEFIRAIFNNDDMYASTRFIRNILLVIFAFMITIKCLTSQKTIKIISYIILLTGILGSIIFISGRLPLVSSIFHYHEFTGIGFNTPGFDIVFILLWAFFLEKYYPFSSKPLLFLLFGISLASHVMAFRLSQYFQPIIVICLGVLFAEIPVFKKMIIVTGASVFSLLILRPLFGGDLGGIQFFPNVSYISDQVVQEMFDLNSSIHLKTRILSWEETLAQFHGLNIIYGLGIGTADQIMETGLPEATKIVIGEPTYSYYLLKTGVLGLLLLIALQVKFVIVSYQNMASALDYFSRAFMLTCFIYGITVIINGFLHNLFITPQISILYGVLMGVLESFRNFQPKTISSGQLPWIERKY
ncbi:MAG: hypothetical protein C4567_16015 [Deltaproteobacteria bacterium]|nr:MAG: hypothetical protein C4567_16015 [Deltaproteobacteria bacterium]